MIFISYRRADSKPYAELIYIRLVEQFGAGKVFFDIEEIELGDRFVSIIEERVTSCDVLLAIIGPKWLTLADDEGRRLHHPDDYVRHEISAALSQKIKVIPVLVGGASVPSRDELPGDIAALADRSAHRVRDESLAQDIEHLIAQLEGHKGFRQAFNALARQLRLHRAALVIVPASVLVMFFAAWVALFDYFDTHIETYTMAVGSWFRRSPASEDVVIVAIDKNTEDHFNKSFDKTYKTWRHEHALLINALSLAGAKAVAFAMVLNDPSPYDDELIAAIQSARRNGTAVIFGTRGKPSSIQGFEQAVTGLGHTCVGMRLDYASTVPLAVKKAGQVGQILPALALLAAYPGPVKVTDEEYWQLLVEDGSRPVKFSFYEQVSVPKQPCTALEEDGAAAQLIIEFRPLEQLRDPTRRHRYEDIAGRAEGFSDSRFRGKIVLVGQENKHDRISVSYRLGKELRYGFEVHADALNTLLQGIHIRPLNPWGQFCIMLGMGTLGAGARFFRPLASPAPRRMYCLAVVSVYLWIAVSLYVEYQILLNTLYHICAFFAAYWAIGKAARRLGLWEMEKH